MLVARSRRFGTSSLPAALTPFVGRERVAASARALLLNGDARLLTITGPGGVGKTRLALHLASALKDLFPDGVVYVTLAAVRDPELVMSAVAGALGLRLDGDRPPLAAIASALRDHEVLLLLDNLEQVLGVGPSLTELLGQCPRVRLLVTSRVPLRVSGEQEFPVPPLSLPPAGRGRVAQPEGHLRGERTAEAGLADASRLSSLASSEAVALFLQQARMVRPEFELTAANANVIAEVVRRLDGLPLAIELAAARSKVLSPQALLVRLTRRFEVLAGGPRDAPPRLRSMRDAVGWSFDLLEEDERAILRRLAAFAGGFSLDAAEAVAGDWPREAGDDCEPADRCPSQLSVLDTVASLVDKSLVRREESTDGAELRFGLLETIREFAAEQLEASGERRVVARRHAAFFLDLAERAEPELTGSAQGAWVARLAQEEDNLRAALAWAIELGESRLALLLTGALWRYWDLRGLLGEGRGWLDRALALDGEDAPEARARALLGAGRLAMNQGAFEPASALLTESRDLARVTGERQVEARAHGFLGLVAWNLADLDRAESLCAEALDLARAAGDKRGVAGMLNNLAGLDQARGRLDDAARRYAEALVLMRGLGDTRSVGMLLSNLGQLSGLRGEFERAIALLEEAGALHRELDDEQGVAVVLTNLGDVIQRQGDAERAANLYAEALARFRDLGDFQNATVVLYHLGALARDRGNSTGAVAQLGEALAAFVELGDRAAAADCLDLLAAVTDPKRDGARAVRFLGGAQALRQATGVARSPQAAVDHDRCSKLLRGALGEEAFASALDDGMKLGLEAMVAEAAVALPVVARAARSQGAPPATDTPEQDRAVAAGLTAREREVLLLLGGGASNREIAEALYITPRTAAAHVAAILAKLELPTRAAAAAWAARNRLV
jgi:predicted ATPase/DNA-binding CsgD family transcriptional regulator